MLSFITMATCALSLCTPQMPETPLLVGDAVPGFGKDVTWHKGKGPEQFAKGTIYVVNFWAPWSRPSLNAIPRLAGIARKHARDKVSVIGIAVAPVKGAPAVADTVKANEKKMHYIVGEDIDRAIVLKMLARAGRGGVPSTMLIDREGRMAWVGGELDGLEAALSKVIAGTWDLEAAATQFNQNIRTHAPFRVSTARFQSLLHKPERRKEAETIARKLLADKALAKLDIHVAIAWILVQSMLELPENAKADFGISLQACEVLAKAHGAETYFILWKFAECNYRAGNLAKAVKYERQAVEWMRMQTDKIRNNPRAKAAMVQHEKRLKEWESELAGATTKPSKTTGSPVPDKSR